MGSHKRLRRSSNQRTAKSTNNLVKNQTKNKQEIVKNQSNLCEIVKKIKEILFSLMRSSFLPELVAGGRKLTPNECVFAGVGWVGPFFPKVQKKRRRSQVLRSKHVGLGSGWLGSGWGWLFLGLRGWLDRTS